MLIVVFHDRGDTLSVNCKDTNLNYKLDLHIITDTEESLIDSDLEAFNHNPVANTSYLNEGNSN